MEDILKVSPEGQIIPHKKLRDPLENEDLVDLKLKALREILEKPVSEGRAGRFKKKRR